MTKRQTDQAVSRKKKDDCDSVRYGLLSIKASSAEPQFSNVYSTAALAVIFLDVSLTVSLPAFSRSQAPPLVGLAASPHRSHVILRI
jgi:hypothetical protein